MCLKCNFQNIIKLVENYRSNETFFRHNYGVCISRAQMFEKLISQLVTAAKRRVQYAFTRGVIKIICHSFIIVFVLTW